jgi:hypothetical protein
VLLLSGGPVGNLETLEEGAGLAVEADITNTLKESLGVEILGVDVVLDVGLLEEFLAIEVLNSNTGISRLFNVESVRHKSEVGVQEPQSLREVLLGGGAWVEHELHPATGRVSYLAY